MKKKLLKSKKTAPRNQKILLVDDNPDHLALFRLLLEQNDFQVVCADGAKDAFHVLDDNEVNVIVCDVMMPEINGQNFIEELRLHKHYANIPIIMITSGADVGEVDLLMSGADLFCPKTQAKKMLVSQVKLLLS
ncbi:MAG: response regulator [Deltaproteobacteria bacterium]|nr:response regulator [Deltaproteobacteria bacterium]